MTDSRLTDYIYNNELHLRITPMRPTDNSFVT